MSRQNCERWIYSNERVAAGITMVDTAIFLGTGASKAEGAPLQGELFHGHFIEHLGSCVYGGLWVGKNSHIPNPNGYRKQAVEYLQALGVPVLRWPGGCFADDYHWRGVIGPREQCPKRVNLHWGCYVEDGSFGTHEFIGLCRLLKAQPYLAGNVGSSTPHELRDWIEYCNYPSGSTLSEERGANGSPEPLRVRYWGRRKRELGLRREHAARGICATLP
jgi:alpha-L-arabinofuranosidase